MEVMREIKLPASNTVRFTFSGADLSSSGIIMPDSHTHKSLGGMEGDDYKNFDIARKNGGVVLWSTVCLEQTIERIILNYFIGPFYGPNTKRQQFENEVLKSSSFQLSFKKQLIHKISESVTALSGKEQSKLQGLLKKIMLWRNAFAHGSLTLDVKTGVELNYYSGGNQSICLSNDYWDAVEDSFNKCTELLKKLEDATTKSEA